MESIKHKATHKVDTYVEAKFNALWGDLDHEQFTVIHLNQYRNKRLTEVSTGTARRELSLIKRSWKYCQSEGYELANLFDLFKMPPSGKVRRRIPSERELQNIIFYTSPQVSDLIRLGIETCCRRSEMLNIGKK